MTQTEFYINAVYHAAQELDLDLPDNPTVEDFEDYFISQMIDDEFSGTIIHWTDLRY